MKLRAAEIFRRSGVALGLALIAFYRKIVSPALHAVFGGNGFCRFSPTCSEYARQALLAHGFFAGSLLAAWRVLRCNPLSAGGPDPVPAKGAPLFRRERVGIFGGSFDPVHDAHLLLAESARKKLRLDRLIFVPAAHSPLKSAAPSASAAMRAEMLRAALVGVPGAEISLWEIERGGKSFSVNTAEHFEEAFPRARLFWILGADQLAQLDKWRDAETLCRKVTFAAMRRDADALPPVPAPLRRVARVVPLDVPRADVSSTEIREKLAAGKIGELRDCLPPAVLNIIRENQLYRNHADTSQEIRDEKNDGETRSRRLEKNGEADAEDGEKAERARREIERDKALVEPCWNDR